MSKLKELGDTIGEEEKGKILSDFQETLLNFCESVLYNGSQSGDEWDCADLKNSERTPSDQGSCSVNLKKGCFRDNNPAAEPSKGGVHRMFCTIFGLKAGDGWRAMRQWNEDRTLPDGSKGVASGKRVDLSEGNTIEATYEYELSRIKWINTFQDCITHSQENGGTPEKTVQYGITRSNVRIWLLKKKFTFQKKRIAANGNHLVLVLTPKDAARAVALRRSQGFTVLD